MMMVTMNIEHDKDVDNTDDDNADNILMMTMSFWLRSEQILPMGVFHQRLATWLGTQLILLDVDDHMTTILMLVFIMLAIANRKVTN